MKLEEYKTDSNHPDEMSVKEIVKKLSELWRFWMSKWLLIICMGIIGILLGYTYAFYKKPVFIATTTFVLEDGSGGGGGGQFAGLASIAGIDLGGGGGGIFQGDNILELYKSRRMVQETLLTPIVFNDKKQLLIDRYIDFNGIRKEWEQNKSLNQIQFSRNKNFSRIQDSVLSVVVNDIIRNYLSVGKPDKKLSIIEANVRSRDEFFAKTFNDKIVENVNNFYIETKTKKSKENVDLLQRKTDSVRAVMNGAIYSAAIISDATPNLNPTRLVQRNAPIQRSQFNAETNRAVLSELVKNLEMSKMTLQKDIPLIQVIDQPIFPLRSEQTGKIKTALTAGFSFLFLSLIVLALVKFFNDLMSE